MKKKILLIHYSQSGQLTAIVDNFCKPFIAAGHSVESIRVTMKKAFEFPWTSKRFFDAMPESVLGISAEINPIEFKEETYDLIVFAYQPWYLSPSIPATSILADEGFRKRIKNTPVLTLIGARNMWLNAQERVKKILSECHAKHIGNIVLTDEHSNPVSAVTILYWMLTGKKDRYFGIFPKPGVSDFAIEGVEDYARKVMNRFEKDDLSNLQVDLVASGAVKVKSNLMFIEARAGKLFSIWANLIIKKKNRQFWLILYKYYLLIALFVIAPIVLTVYMLIFKPFLGASIQKREKYYLGIS